MNEDDGNEMVLSQSDGVEALSASGNYIWTADICQRKKRVR